MFSFIDKYLVLLNWLLGTEQITLSIDKYLIRGNQIGVFKIFRNHVPGVNVGS